MSENKTGCIYIIKNFANGKKYIGKTNRNPLTRFNEHMQEAFAQNSPTYNYCLSRAIRKYGKQAFDWAILAEDIPEEDLLLIEAHYIDMYNTTDPKVGYNTSKGFNDNSDIDKYREMQPDEDYEPNPINFDDISDEDIENFLNEL